VAEGSLASHKVDECGFNAAGLHPRAGVRDPGPLHRAHQLPHKRPTGYVAPWWEFSTVTNELLVERGIKYDHSLMHRDFEPYYVRVGDSWTPIDYDKPAAE
jgi:hypothetical protein